MLKQHQSVVALLIAVASVIAFTPGSQPVAPAPAAVQAPQSLMAAYPPVEADPALVLVPATSLEPTVAPRSEPERGVAALRVLEPGRYVTIDAFVEAAVAVGWEPTQTLITIATCESGADLDYDGIAEAMDTQAQSPTGDRGALQINQVHAAPGALIERMGYGWDDMLSLGPNLAVGLALYRAAADAGRDAFSPWMCNP